MTTSQTRWTSFWEDLLLLGDFDSPVPPALRSSRLVLRFRTLVFVRKRIHTGPTPPILCTHRLSPHAKRSFREGIQCEHQAISALLPPLYQFCRFFESKAFSSLSNTNPPDHILFCSTKTTTQTKTNPEAFTRIQKGASDSPFIFFRIKKKAAT